MAKRTCSIDGCESPAHLRGWCNAHYKRWRRHGDPTAGRTAKGRPMAFLKVSLAVETDECQIWPFQLNEHGYGMIMVGRRPTRVTRLVCEFRYGPAPEGAYACHGPCRNPACFNPRHLSWGTPTQNSMDRHRDDTMVQGEEHPDAKLTEMQVIEIIHLHSSGVRQAELSRMYGVTPGHVSTIVNRKAWKHLKVEVGSQQSDRAL